MAARTNLVLVPGLLCAEALWAPQMAALSDIAEITVADHTRQDSMAEIAASILAAAPERFALAGFRWAATSPMRSSARGRGA